MKPLTLYTQHYAQALQEFAAKAQEEDLIIIRQAKWRNNGRLFGLNLAWKAPKSMCLANNIALLLEYVAMQENPIYRESLKLRELAQSSFAGDVRKTCALRIRKFLHTSSIMHIEGYVTFRMPEYCEKLDLMSYALIKKLEMAKKDGL